MKAPTLVSALLGLLPLVSALDSRAAPPTADYRFAPVERLNPARLTLLARPVATQPVSPTLPRFESYRSLVAPKPPGGAQPDTLHFDTSLPSQSRSLHFPVSPSG